MNVIFSNLLLNNGANRCTDISVLNTLYKHLLQSLNTYGVTYIAYFCLCIYLIVHPIRGESFVEKTSSISDGTDLSVQQFSHGIDTYLYS